MSDVAVLGLGRMGRAMAIRLHEAGHTVTLWNRTASRASELAEATGMRVAGSPREAGNAPIVLSSLADDQAVTKTYEGDDGLIAGLRVGTVVVETSTVDPSTVVRLSEAIGARGASLLDAPVSGSVPAVEKGALTFMVGGSLDALERVRPILDTLGSTTFALGAVGTGAAMKLAVNAIVHSLNGALSEALVLAERAGIDRRTAYDVFESSAAGAPFVTYKRMAFEDPQAAVTAFSLELVAKDLRLIHTFANRLEASVPQAETNQRVAEQAIADGDGERDMSWLAQRFRDGRGSG